MIVVMDTTETYRDLRLEGPNYKLLYSYMHRTSSRLAIPRIVIEETVNHFRERLKKTLDGCETAVRQVNELTGNRDAVSLHCSTDVDNELELYRVHLGKQIKWLSGTIIDYESIDLKSIVERSLLRRRPFDGEGRKGFRDAVLWESILRQLVQEGSGGAEIALITSNSTDFGKEGVLADDLQDDCIAVGKSAECIKLFDKLQTFIDREVKPHLSRLEDIQSQIQEGDFGFDPEEFFEDNFDAICREVRTRVLQSDLDRLLRPLPGEYRSPELHKLSRTIDSWEVVDVWRLDEGQVAVGVDVDVPGKIKCMQGHEVWFAMGDEPYADFIEDEYVGDAAFTLHMTVILDEATRSVEDFEVNDLEAVLGTEWPYFDID